MTTRLLIAADSWAWTWQDHGKGFQPEQGYPAMLLDHGLAVTNISLAGASNFGLVERIKQELDQNHYHAVVFTQTDPMRENIHDGRLDHHRVFQWAQDAGTLSRFITQRLQTLYQTLTHISQRYRTPVWVMGGCSCFPQGLVDPGSCAVIIPSIPEMLIPGYQDHVWYDTNHWTINGYNDLVRRELGVRFKEWHRIADLILYKISNYSSSEYFRPDRWHPNIDAHHEIKDRILRSVRELANK